ncbi:MAG: 23S rRNA (adenine(2030)-N(6))-methyltransferase RlmJ [Hyphomonadaceae bacterium]|nr:23S rRNA (adenine(2030)-N(6))-methyltransferase RlmJ [Hyphomonadaceae bacterium]
MNYRHAFHAGNHADVLKHAILVFCLDALLRKPTPFAVLDTHAGRGLYNLEGDEATRSPEWRDGVGKLWPAKEPPAILQRYLGAIRAFNADGALRTYPGSPALIARALRADDVFMACELHPEEHAALRRTLPRLPGVQLHLRDGWEALTALLPPPQRRGLVLIDPPYEAPDDLDRAVRSLAAALKRFAHGVFLWWRPLKSGADLDAADAELCMHTHGSGVRPTLRADLWAAPAQATGKLTASSMFVVNPPFGLEDALREGLPAITAAFGEGAGWRIS